jgi:hypothetical protein
VPPSGRLPDAGVLFDGMTVLRLVGVPAAIVGLVEVV